MKSHYGYIKRHRRRDKDHLDIFVKPGTRPDFSGSVYVVDQVNAKGSFDEHKVVLGASSLDEAKRLYSENYTKGFKVGPVTEMTLPQFRAWAQSKFTKRPVKGLSFSEWEQVGREARTPADLERLLQTEGEIGWAERGGHLLRAPSADGLGDVIGRTQWVAKSDFWPGRPNNVTIDAARSALKKVQSGEAMNASERSFIDYAEKWLGEKEAEHGLKTPDRMLAPAEAKAPARELGDRRRDGEQRKRVAEMSAAEKDQALLTDELTGIPNLRAYNEAESTHAGHHVAADMDNVKWVNDFIGHDAGNELIRAMATALYEEAKARGARAFRVGGDEFSVLSHDQKQADAVMQAATERLARSDVTATMKGGEEATLKGVRFSYGIGKGRQSAERNLQWHKDERTATGERSDRGEPPAQLARKPAQQAGKSEGDAGSEGQVALAASAKYRRGAGEGMTEQAARKALADTIQKTRVPIRVHADVESLRKVPGLEGSPDDAKGAYWNGVIHAVAGAHADAVDLQSTIARHEVTHAGIDALYGSRRRARSR
jgi:diguanylate cyclase (GGDEF)-like protein